MSRSYSSDADLAVGCDAGDENRIIAPRKWRHR
jgi:hypothetical protein